MSNLKIGITERGDAGIDLSWGDVIDAYDGAILITKNPARPEFQELALKHKDKSILHATITGNGGTIYEPGVPDYKTTLDALANLIYRGFDPRHIVLRMDPIIPKNDTCQNFVNAFRYFDSLNTGVTRMRVSILDNYKHVQQRFANAGLPVLYNGNWQADPHTVEAIARLIDGLNQRAKHPVTVEACAENQLVATARRLGLQTQIEQVGCVSVRDLQILGIDIPAGLSTNPQNRNGCCCLSCKQDMLQHRNRCPHACLYCYWRD